MRVFISDRSAPVRERLADMISAIEGAEIVGEARPTSDFLAAVTQAKPDVVVSDVRPVVMEQLSEVRKMPTVKTSPIVVLITDDASSLYKGKLLGAGADYVFHRSGEFEKVLELLTDLSRREST